jgi:hypothetical protein
MHLGRHPHCGAYLKVNESFALNKLSKFFIAKIFFKCLRKKRETSVCRIIWRELQGGNALLKYFFEGIYLGVFEDNLYRGFDKLSPR